MTDATRDLAEWASRTTRMPTDVILQQMRQNRLSDRGWTHFLPSDVQELWARLGIDARIIAFVDAFERFNNFDPDAAIA